jgi:hypothetical protein
MSNKIHPKFSVENQPYDTCEAETSNLRKFSGFNGGINEIL